jgi:hypothetical protein
MLYISEAKDGSEVINLTRGDDACLEIPMENSEKESYTMGETEYLIFGVRKIPSKDSELLINIESAPGSNRIVFNHVDTADLEIGEYSAEVQLMTAEGKRITVWPLPQGRQRIKENINRKNFVLMPEVVYT